MAFRGVISHLGLTAAMKERGITKRIFADAEYAALSKAVQDWRRTALDKHFREGAVERYGYKIRNVRGQRRKRKKYKHARPLVLTGISEAMIKAAPNLTIRKRIDKRTGAEWRIVAPKYFFQYKPGVSPDKTDEMTRLTQDELDRSLEVFGKWHKRFLWRAIARKKHRQVV